MKLPSLPAYRQAGAGERDGVRGDSLSAMTFNVFVLDKILDSKERLEDLDFRKECARKGMID